VPSLVPEGIAIRLLPNGSGESIEQRNNSQEKSTARKLRQLTGMRLFALPVDRFRIHRDLGTIVHVTARGISPPEGLPVRIISMKPKAGLSWC
jgi:hypothetical protein